MTLFAFLAIVAALWAIAAVLWILDAPNPRQTVDVLLATQDLGTSDPVAVAPALRAA